MAVVTGSKLRDHFEKRDSELNLNLENKYKVILKLMIICNAYHIICHEKKSLPLIRKLQKHFYEWSVCYDFQGLSDVSLPANHFSKNWLSQSC